MDFWPSDSRQGARSYVRVGKKGRKPKEKADDRTPGYPVLELGPLTAATLVDRNGKLEWSALQDTLNRDNRLTPRGTPIKLYPRTRRPSVTPPRMTIANRADYAMQFLQKYHAEIDVPSELLKEQMEVDDKETEIFRTHDPYVANMLAPLAWSDGTSSPKLAALAFTAGEFGHELNVSPFKHLGGQLVFKPSPLCMRSYTTPIKQITTSSAIGDAFLAVRTLSSIAIHQVEFPPTDLSVGFGGLTLVDTVTLGPSNHGSSPAMDIAFCPTHYDTFILATQEGKVFRGSASSGTKRCYPVYQDMDPPSANTFRRVQWGSDDSIGMVASQTNVRKIDLRTSAGSSRIFSTARAGEAITSIDRPCRNLISLSTNREVVWLDERNTKRPLLAVTHYREMDYSLMVQNLPTLSRPLTFLTSLRTGFVTIYDVSAGEDSLLHPHANPCSLPPIVSPLSGPLAGYSIFDHGEEDGFATAFHLAHNGSLYSLDLNMPRGDDAMLIDEVPQPILKVTDVEWSAATHELDLKTRALQPDPGPVGAREFHEVDFRSAYRRLFGMDADHASGASQASLADVHNTMLKMTRFFKEEESERVETIMTSFDVGYRVNNSEERTVRSQFLTGSPLSTAYEYSSFSVSGIPVDNLRGHAIWQHSHARFLQQSIAGIDTSGRFSSHYLDNFDVSGADSEEGAAAQKRARDARRQLEIDLALSSDVFSARQLSARPPEPAVDKGWDDAFETMSRATEAMSLGGGEPPPVHFGFLRPRHRPTIDYYTEPAVGEVETRSEAHNPSPTLGKSEEKNEFEAPLGVRLLVSEWDIGADPTDYRYKDPYGDAVDETRRRGGSRSPTPPPRTQTQSQFLQRSLTQPRAPPTIVASSRLNSNQISPPHHLPRSRGFGVGSLSQLPSGASSVLSNGRFEPLLSRPSFWAPPPESSQTPTQEFVVSTQVLPGPFGGRPAAGKKKVTKKRVGGF